MKKKPLWKAPSPRKTRAQIIPERPGRHASQAKAQQRKQHQTQKCPRSVESWLLSVSLSHCLTSTKPIARLRVVVCLPGPVRRPAQRRRGREGRRSCSGGEAKPPGRGVKGVHPSLSLKGCAAVVFFRRSTSPPTLVPYYAARPVVSLCGGPRCRRSGGRPPPFSFLFFLFSERGKKVSYSEWVRGVVSGRDEMVQQTSVRARARRTRILVSKWTTWGGEPARRLDVLWIPSGKGGGGEGMDGRVGQGGLPTALGQNVAMFCLLPGPPNKGQRWTPFWTDGTGGRRTNMCACVSRSRVAPSLLKHGKGTSLSAACERLFADNGSRRGPRA